MEEASNYKLRRICEVLELSETDRVIEIGTGWGASRYMPLKTMVAK